MVNLFISAYFFGGVDFMNYGRVFQRLRMEKGMTQKKAAKGIVSQSTLSRFENCGNIDIISFMLLLDRIGMSPDQFFRDCICSRDDAPPIMIMFRETLDLSLKA